MSSLSDLSLFTLPNLPHPSLTLSHFTLSPLPKNIPVFPQLLKSTVMFSMFSSLSQSHSSFYSWCFPASPLPLSLPSFWWPQFLSFILISPPLSFYIQISALPLKYSFTLSSTPLSPLLFPLLIMFQWDSHFSLIPWDNVPLPSSSLLSLTSSLSLSLLPLVGYSIYTYLTHVLLMCGNYFMPFWLFHSTTHIHVDISPHSSSLHCISHISYLPLSNIQSLTMAEVLVFPCSRILLCLFYIIHSV